VGSAATAHTTGRAGLQDVGPHPRHHPGARATHAKPTCSSATKGEHRTPADHDHRDSRSGTNPIQRVHRVPAGTIWMTIGPSRWTLMVCGGVGSQLASAKIMQTVTATAAQVPAAAFKSCQRSCAL
jgi:hypothetical protein